VADNHWLNSLLPIRAVTFDMCFTESCTPGFFHQAALTAWLRRMLGSPDDYDLHLTIDCPEQGRRHFRAGDHYHFTLFALGETGRAWISLLVTRLLSDAVDLNWDRPMAFRNNWKLERILSWPDAKEMGADEAIETIEAGHVQETVALLCGQHEIAIRIVSPWRVLRERKVASRRKGEMRFCRDSSHLLPDNGQPLWLIRIGDTLRDLARRRGAVVPARKESGAVRASGDLFWVDASYCNAGGERKPMGGVMGMIGGINPAALSDEQLMMLVMGQYLGAGQRRAFGYGRYQLVDGKGKPLFRRLPSGTLLERALSDSNLEQARLIVTANRKDDDGFPDEESEPDAAKERERLHAMAERLVRGRYAVPALNGFIHEDADGGLRPLAAPPLYDRILQRAVHQVLSPMLDTLMDHGSYGFRAGRSRYQVRDLIQRLYRDGYRWVFESDIRSFFDTVAWQKLEVRLRALLGDDPAVSAILDWMQSPVRWKNLLIHRDGGLPQGSPLSPVLANLMLDDFDHDLRDAGCRLIRFADDFVIVARSRQAAEQGGRLAEHTGCRPGAEGEQDPDCPLLRRFPLSRLHVCGWHGG